nr:hypothetical protein [Couchioplanes caeruleus]
MARRVTSSRIGSGHSMELVVMACSSPAVRYEATLHITAINEWLHALRDAP